MGLNSCSILLLTNIQERKVDTLVIFLLSRHFKPKKNKIPLNWTKYNYFSIQPEISSTKTENSGGGVPRRQRMMLTDSNESSGNLFL